MKVADSYSVIVIPRDRAKIRRWVVSRERILGTFFMALGCIFITATVTFGLLHYHDKYVATQELREKGAEYKKERIRLLARLSELEAIVEQNEIFAGRLENVLGINPARGVEVGVGGETEEFQVDSSLQLAALLSSRKNKEAFDGISLKAYGLKAIDLAAEAKEVGERLKEIYEFNPDAAYFWSSVPTISPLDGWITSSFGMRRSPLNGRRQFHQGIDIASPYGSPVMATGDGTVTYAGRSGGLGKKIVVDHGYGMISIYGHNAHLLVRAGDAVQRGQVIAKVGSTGRSTGPHLHYEILVDGVPVNPKRFILKDF